MYLIHNTILPNWLESCHTQLNSWQCTHWYCQGGMQLGSEQHRRSLSHDPSLHIVDILSKKVHLSYKTSSAHLIKMKAQRTLQLLHSFQEVPQNDLWMTVCRSHFQPQNLTRKTEVEKVCLS